MGMFDVKYSRKAGLGLIRSVNSLVSLCNSVYVLYGVAGGGGGTESGV